MSSHERRAFFDELSATWDEHVADVAFLARLRAALDRLAPAAHETVLDLGCGTGNLTRELLRRLSGRGHVLAADFSAGMLAVARAKLRGAGSVVWLHADAAALPLPDRALDRVICFSAWPHFPEPARVAAEARRVLRPGGALHVLHVDGRETINRVHGAAGAAVRHDLLPPAERLAELLAAAGLEVSDCLDTADQYLVSALRSGGP